MKSSKMVNVLLSIKISFIMVEDNFEIWLSEILLIEMILLLSNSYLHHDWKSGQFMLTTESPASQDLCVDRWTITFWRTFFFCSAWALLTKATFGLKFFLSVVYLGTVWMMISMLLINFNRNYFEVLIFNLRVLHNSITLL